MLQRTTITAAPGRVEFIVLISSVMMLVAFGIDSMLPALPDIGRALGVADENDRPFVITAFLGGFSVSLLFAGTLSDRYGRRRLLLGSLFGFLLASLACALVTSFEQLLVARLVQGMAAAGGQVIIRSVVRDRFAGRDMAQVMSLASMIFMLAPILAPAMGQLVLEFGPWRWIFGALALIGLAVWLWALTRLPETLAQDNRIPIERTRLMAAARTVITDRMSLGYSLAQAVIACALFGFLLSVQQIFETTFRRPELLPTGFAIMASGMAAASLLNAAIVRRFGMRRIGHAALMWFTAIAALHAFIAVTGQESLVTFIVLQTIMMMGFALVMGNFNAMAMENMGGVAGMANSLQGTLSNIVGLVAGTIVGQAFDGTTAPLYIAYTLCGAAALAIVFATEGGRFFVARNAPVAQGV
jgi:MFS transporter, DHA1 family, multidrug resistance protein